MNMIRFLIVTLCVFISSGCSVLTYRDSAGSKFFRGSIGSDSKIRELTVTTDKEGLKSLTVKGQQSNQSELAAAMINASTELRK